MLHSPPSWPSPKFFLIAIRSGCGDVHLNHDGVSVWQPRTLLRRRAGGRANGLLLAPLVDLGEEGLEDALLDALGLVDLVDHGAELGGALLLELLEERLELHVVEELLDDGLLGLVLLAVVVLEDAALVRGGAGEGLVDEPGALVVEDVGADLADVGRVAEVVEGSRPGPGSTRRGGMRMASAVWRFLGVARSRQ